MPRYEYLCECSNEPKTFTISLSFSEYQSVIPCPCGGGEAKRVFNSFTVQEGLTAKEKQFGTTVKRKQMTEFVKAKCNSWPTLCKRYKIELRSSTSN